MATSEKPELGVKPEKLWIEGRVKVLADAITRHANRGAFPKSVNKWADELLRRVRERVDMEE